MKRSALLVALAASILLPFGCTTAPQVVDDYRTNYLYAYTCAALEDIKGEDVCDGLPPPKVINSPKMVRAIGGPTTMAYYEHGATEVVLSKAVIANINGYTVASVTVHEMVHYILYFNDPTITTCATEYLARKVEAQNYGKPYTDLWRPAYGC